MLWSAFLTRRRNSFRPGEDFLRNFSSFLIEKLSWAKYYRYFDYREVRIVLSRKSTAYFEVSSGLCFCHTVYEGFRHLPFIMHLHRIARIAVQDFFCLKKPFAPCLRDIFIYITICYFWSQYGMVNAIRTAGRRHKRAEQVWTLFHSYISGAILKAG